MSELVKDGPDAAVVGKATAALYGVALGDAMGMPGELWSRQQIREHFGEITGFLPGPPGHFIVDGYAAGQVTDDTQQTLMLAGAIIESGGRVEPAVIARHLVAWADRVGASEGHFLGPNSARAIEALRAGAPLQQIGVRSDTNGAAMRIAPVGIISPPNDLVALVDRVEAACAVSHRTTIAIAGASMVAAALSVAFTARGLDEVFAAAYEAGSLGLLRGNPVPGASLRRRTEWALRRVAAGGTVEEVLEDLYDFLGAGVAMTETVPVALALVALSGGDPIRASLLAANLGGDTDTIGAIAGGICGAYAGMAGIPEDHRVVLDEVNAFDIPAVAAALAVFRQRNQ
ncbi:ADP-ribosylglycohydrolase family protein [Actinopolymorpha alba]|uniref:ADP-ribosylglycohydrolase family protein n=1 Tax=Actinopolymorpha alba TaxID=533267 RepID=UPI0007C7CA68|nr:ADP-ribosylglycohydrolase family protein [Actinopolymorpha alba]